MRCFIGAGSNTGEPAENIGRAEMLLSGDPRVAAVRSSALYETDPMGYEHQPRFINAVFEVETGCTTLELFILLKQIERTMGRTKGVRYGPRVIDLDILLCGDLIYQDAEISVPHARMAERPFVLYPLAELAPGTVHPLSGITVEDMRSKLRDLLGIRKIDVISQPSPSAGRGI